MHCRLLSSRTVAYNVATIFSYNFRSIFDFLFEKVQVFKSLKFSRTLTTEISPAVFLTNISSPVVSTDNFYCTELMCVFLRHTVTV